MPEKPEVEAFKQRIIRRIHAHEKRFGSTLHARLQLFPRVFAEGTKMRPYTSCTTRQLGLYSSSLECDVKQLMPNPHDLARSKNQPWSGLETAHLKSGPLIVASRGKCLLLAAGHHAVAINFGLEGNIIIVPRSDFDEIIRNDAPGPNKNRRKADRLRSFVLPARFVEAGSAPSSERYINIFAAFVTSYEAIMVCDFARLVRLHIVSSPSIWNQQSVSVDSMHWGTFWSAFPDGPDWYSERSAAEQALDDWRHRVCNGMGSTGCIVNALAANDNHAFGGFGRHLANDFLYLIGWHPGMPVVAICQNQQLYDQLKEAIPRYMSQWHSAEFHRKCTTEVNSRNPFAFNTTVDVSYMQSHVHVFRSSQVRMPSDLYYLYLRAGLFDPSHIIGASYCASYSRPVVVYVDVPVQAIGPPLNAYTVIQAQPPDGTWQTGPSIINVDMRNAGYKTTIGPAQFHESKLNMIQTPPIKPGRPIVVKTGHVGRPRRPLTKARLQEQERKAARSIAIQAKGKGKKKTNSPSDPLA